MATVEEDFGHSELVGGEVTTLHRHPGIIKSDVIIGVSDGSSGLVTFTTSFPLGPYTFPHVVLTLRGSSLAVDVPLLGVVSRIGFTWTIHKGHGGQNHTWDLYWIAVDFGNL